MFSFQILFVVAVSLFLIISLYKELSPPVGTFVFAIVALLVGQILEPKDVLNGFANEQIAVVMMLLILSEIIQKTGLFDIALKKPITPNLSYKGFLSRL